MPIKKFPSQGCAELSVVNFGGWTKARLDFLGVQRNCKPLISNCVCVCPMPFALESLLAGYVRPKIAV